MSGSSCRFRQFNYIYLYVEIDNFLSLLNEMYWPICWPKVCKIKMSEDEEFPYDSTEIENNIPSDSYSLTNITRTFSRTEDDVFSKSDVNIPSRHWG